MPFRSDDSVIKVRDLAVDFANRRVLNGVNLDLKRGEILGFVGASGAGKSVLTRTIIGLLPMQAGSIEVLGVELSKASQAERQSVDRRWGVLFQQGALFSSLTSGKNVEFPIREYLRLSPKLTTEIAISKLEMVGLKPDVYRNFPSELSGGMIKRVALARALAIEPRMLLLDEPFGALDAKVRKELRTDLRRIHDHAGVTTVFVTHDQEEAFAVADLVAVMKDGRIEQYGAPADVRRNPRTPFVSEFLSA